MTRDAIYKCAVCGKITNIYMGDINDLERHVVFEDGLHTNCLIWKLIEKEVELPRYDDT